MQLDPRLDDSMHPGFPGPCLLSLMLPEHRSASGRPPAFPGGCELLTLALPEEFGFPSNANESTEPASPCPELDYRSVVGEGVLQRKVREKNQSPRV